ncbi:hypothetical protein NMY22_g18983 [Coprinellus aureogranulatus]|nr:hypothetical protein NMY22_g18983 [Coprinellus aureogranulatus]
MSSRIQNVQNGIKALTDALVSGVLGAVTLLTSLCSRIYDGFAIQISRVWCIAAGVLEALVRSLKLWVSVNRSSGNLDIAPQPPLLQPAAFPGILKS